jgi:hypothetical protein
VEKAENQHYFVGIEREQKKEPSPVFKRLSRKQIGEIKLK